MQTPTRSGLLAALLIGALSLTACGDSTVDDNDSTPTSIAPLERGPKESAKRTEDSDGEEASASRGETPANPRPADPSPQDQGAREIDEIPEAEIARTPEDIHFLGELSDEGIDIEGVESQLIGTASIVCSDDAGEFGRATVSAVAGQLVNQDRTDKSVEDVTAIIEAGAKNAYC